LLVIAGGLIGLVLGSGTVGATPCAVTQLFDVQSAIIDSGITQVLSGKMDADTLADLVIVHGASGTVEIQRHVSGTQFTTVATLTWTHPIQRALLADIDRDGKMDLAFTDDSSELVIFRGVGDGSMVLSKTILAPYPVFDLAAADFGNGGALEIVVSHPTSGRVTTFVSTSGLNYTAVTTDISTYVPDPRWLAIGKFNTDVLWDVMVSRAAGQRIYLLKGSGSGGVGNGAFAIGTSILPVAPATSLRTADVNGDGHDDVIVGSSARVEWVLGPVGSAGQFNPGSSFAVTGGPVTDLLVGDVTADGSPDILCARQSSGVVTALASGVSSDYAVTGQPVSMVLADLDGTNGPDVVVGTTVGVSALVSRCDAPAPPPPPPPPSPPPNDSIPPIDPPPHMSPADAEEGPIPPLVAYGAPPAPPDPGPSPTVAAWPREGVVLCDAPGEQSTPSGVDDYAHGAYFAWIDARSGAPAIYATRIDAEGHRVAGWLPNGNPVATAPSVPSQLTLVTAGEDGIWLVWMDARDSIPSVYFQKVRPDGSIPLGWPLNGRRVCSTPQSRYQAFSDFLGGLKISWAGSGVGGYSIFAQHLDPDGNPYSGWGDCGASLPVGEGGGCPQPISVFYSGSAPSWLGGILALRKYVVQCGTCHGCYNPGASWSVTDVKPSAGAPKGVSVGAASVVEITSDGVGGQFYWGDTNNMYRDGGVFNPSWAISLPTFAQQAIDPDTRGGFFVSWYGPSDLRVTRVENDGSYNAAWGAFAGRPLVDAPAQPATPLRIAVDEASGGLIAWNDFRGGIRQLYSTWIRSDGTRGPGWQSDGDPFGPAQAALEIGPIVGNRRDAAIIAWRDQRAGDWNLYAYRVTTAGPPTSVPQEGTGATSLRGVPIATLALAGVRPNPIAGDLIVHFSLSRSGDAIVRALDVSGREVGRREMRNLSAGPHVASLGTADALGPGVYLLELVAEGRRLHAKAIKTR